MNEIIWITSAVSGVCAVALLVLLLLQRHSLKRAEKELAKARDLLAMPNPEPKIETYRLTTLHAWAEIDAKMVEIMKPEEFDEYLRAHLAHKIANGIKPRLKIEKKCATTFGIRYETELTIKEEPLCAPLTPIK